MNTTPSASPHLTSTPVAAGRALVLGGGGSTGNAWLIGVIAGLSAAGLDVTNADLIIGTSAGSTAAVQLGCAPPAQLLSAILSAVPPEPSSRDRFIGGRGPVGSVVDHLRRTGAIIAAAADASDMRRRLGAAALEMDAASDGSAQTQRRAVVASRLAGQHWPHQRVLITAVDARTGEPVVFDRDSGIDVVDAIAASTSSGAAYRIGERRYIDGGYRRNENADLASGYERVLVLSPFGGRSRMPMEWGMDLATQVDELLRSGSAIETVFPDDESEHMFGANAMDPSLRPPAAQAGYQQGIGLAERLGESGAERA